LEKQQGLLGLAIDLNPEQSNKLQSFIRKVVATSDGMEALWKEHFQGLVKVQEQQSLLDTHWQQLEQRRGQWTQRHRELEQIEEDLDRGKQELSSACAAMEQARVDFQVQQKLLHHKQELLGRLNLQLEQLHTLYNSVNLLEKGSGRESIEHKVDVNALENMPLRDLEALVKGQHADLDKFVSFLNDQEEELKSQFQTVHELENQLAAADEAHRERIADELREQQELKRMLEEPLMPQRKKRREIQTILHQHIQILHRRKGIFEPEFAVAINLEPILLHLEEQHNNAQQEQLALQKNIDHLQNSLLQTQRMIEQQSAEQEAKSRKLQQLQETWQHAVRELAELQSQVCFYEATLHPLQDNLNSLRQNLEKLGEWLSCLQ
jgi:chromosome segregation ATPase